VAARVADVGLETFEQRGPIPGLSSQALVSLQEALAHVDLEDKQYASTPPASPVSSLAAPA